MPWSRSRTGQGSSLANSSKRMAASWSSLRMPVVRSPGNQGSRRVRESADSGADAWALCWVCLFEGGEAFAEAGCVLVGYGEDADAALGAAGMADEMVAAAAGRRRRLRRLRFGRELSWVMNRLFVLVGVLGVCYRWVESLDHLSNARFDPLRPEKSASVSSSVLRSLHLLSAQKGTNETDKANSSSDLPLRSCSTFL